MSSLVAVTLAPELIIERVAPKPRGGTRRRPGPARTSDRWSHPSKKRAATHQEGLVVDAFDAAFFIGIHCVFWNAVQVLAHPEIARLANLEARSRIERRRADLPIMWWATSSGRKARAGIEDDLAELTRATDVITEAHDAGVIRAA